MVKKYSNFIVLMSVLTGSYVHAGGRYIDRAWRYGLCFDKPKALLIELDAVGAGTKNLNLDAEKAPIPLFEIRGRAGDGVKGFSAQIKREKFSRFGYEYFLYSAMMAKLNPKQEKKLLSGYSEIIARLDKKAVLETKNIEAFCLTDHATKLPKSNLKKNSNNSQKTVTFNNDEYVLNDDVAEPTIVRMPVASPDGSKEKCPNTSSRNLFESIGREQAVRHVRWVKSGYFKRLPAPERRTDSFEVTPLCEVVCNPVAPNLLATKKVRKSGRKKSAAAANASKKFHERYLKNCSGIPDDILPGIEPFWLKGDKKNKLLKEFCSGHCSFGETSYKKHEIMKAWEEELIKLGLISEPCWPSFKSNPTHQKIVDRGHLYFKQAVLYYMRMCDICAHIFPKNKKCMCASGGKKETIRFPQ